MPASFPSAIKNFSAVVNGVTKLVAALFNSPYDEITAIETALGVNLSAVKFGTWDNGPPYVKDTSYLAAADGVVEGYGDANNGIVTGYTDSSDPPTTKRWGNTYTTSISMPVRKGDYWKVTVSSGAGTFYFIPRGT